MSAGALPSSPDPLCSLVVVPSDLVAMPNPPPLAPSDLVAMPTNPPHLAPPAVAEEEEEEEEEENRERPLPPMRMKLFTYAMYCVCGGMGRTGENLLAAFVVIHYLKIIVSILTFYTDGAQARFWTLVGHVLLFLCYAFTTFISCMFIRYYMRVDGVYNVEIDLPQQHPAPAAAAEQLPPPPPEMDMC